MVKDKNFEKRCEKIQVRITPFEKDLLKKLLEADKDLTISKIFRSSLRECCKKRNIS